MVNENLVNLGVSLAANFIYDISKGIIKLLPHQEKNLKSWIDKWNPTDADLEKISKNEKLQRIFSILFDKVQNEIFEEKISNWGKIADNVLRGKEPNFDMELFFIKLFSDLPVPTLHYLLKLKSVGSMKMFGMYPVNNSNTLENGDEERYFAENTAVCQGLVVPRQTDAKMILTAIGDKFIDFIGEKFQNSNK